VLVFGCQFMGLFFFSCDLGYALISAQNVNKVHQ